MPIRQIRIIESPLSVCWSRTIFFLV